MNIFSFIGTTCESSSRCCFFVFVIFVSVLLQDVIVHWVTWNMIPGSKDACIFVTSDSDIIQHGSGDSFQKADTSLVNYMTSYTFIHVSLNWWCGYWLLSWDQIICRMFSHVYNTLFLCLKLCFYIYWSSFRVSLVDSNLNIIFNQ